MPGSVGYGIYAYSFELSSSSLSHERVIYNFLDFIGDCGGLFDGLKIMCSFILLLVSTVARDSIYQVIISHVYYKSSDLQHSGPLRRNSMRASKNIIYKKEKWNSYQDGECKVNNQLDIQKFLIK